MTEAGSNLEAIGHTVRRRLRGNGPELGRGGRSRDENRPNPL